MINEIKNYHYKLEQNDRKICDALYELIEREYPDAENKVWHAHPVWFFDGNPIVGYSVQKKGVRLMFWSGADFGEDMLNVSGGKFKDASAFYNDLSDIDLDALKRCLQKGRDIQWDYKNIVKRKGVLEKLK